MRLPAAMRRHAFTLLEIVVVVAILAVLAAIGLSLSAPAREKARQTACASNLRQLHAAVMMYTADVDAAEEVPGLGPLACNGAYKKPLDPYVKSKAAWFCPDVPARLVGKVGTSYVWMPIRAGMFGNPSPGEKALLLEQQRRIEAMGTRFPLYICDIHDEAFYQPRERDVDDLLTQPFVVEISVAGSIYSGRFPRPRTRPMEAWAALP